MPAKLTEGRLQRHRHSLVTHGSRLGDGLGRHQVGLTQASGARGLIAPLFDPTLTVFAPGDLRQFHARGGAALAVDASGQLRQFAAGELRIVPSPAGVLAALREPASTNKSTNANANPTSLGSTSKSGDAAAVLSLVDDSAALAAAGLSGVCSSGQVYCLDNSAGTAMAFAFPGNGGVAGNTNTHTLSIYARSLGPAASICLSVNGNGTTAIPSGGYYARFAGTGVAAASSNVQVQAPAGGIVYFILNQLEEQPFVTSPIVTNGAAAARARDEIVVPASFQNAQPLSLMLDYAMPATETGSRMLVGSPTGIGITNAGLMRSDPAGFVSSNNNTQVSTTNPEIRGGRTRAMIAQDTAVRLVGGNGGAVAGDAPTMYGAASRFVLGQGAPGSDQATDSALYIHEFRTWRRRVPNEQLRLLTA